VFTVGKGVTWTRSPAKSKEDGRYAVITVDNDVNERRTIDRVCI
jgi:hypothetical protein